MRVCPRWPQIKRIDAPNQSGATCSWRTSWCCSPTAIFNVDQILCTVTLATLNNSTTSIHSRHLWLQKVWSQMEGLKSWRLWAPCPVSLYSLGGVLGSCCRTKELRWMKRFRWNQRWDNMRQPGADWTQKDRRKTSCSSMCLYELLRRGQVVSAAPQRPGRKLQSGPGTGPGPGTALDFCLISSYLSGSLEETRLKFE